MKNVFIWPGLVMGFSLVWLALELLFLKHFLEVADYFHATECFCYFVILGCVPMIFISLFVNSEAVHAIVEKMNEDYHVIRNLGPRYRQPFLEGQVRIWQLCCGWYGFEISVGSIYAMAQIVSLVYHSLFATLDEESIRPLQFPMWLPYDDPYRTPNYEIFLSIEFFIMACVVNTFSGLEESVALLSRYDERRVEAQLILNKRMKNIVNMHISVLDAVKTVSSVYGPALVYQVMFTSVAICLIAYQVAEKLQQGHFDFLFFALGMAACLQLWIPCYLGTRIRDKILAKEHRFIPRMIREAIEIKKHPNFNREDGWNVPPAWEPVLKLTKPNKKKNTARPQDTAFEVGDAAWECGWHRTSLGLLVRNDIIIIVLRAQQPVTIKFIGLPNVNLETFSGLMTKSYSYFNMVRQYS